MLGDIEFGYVSISIYIRKKK